MVDHVGACCLVVVTARQTLSVQGTCYFPSRLLGGDAHCLVFQLGLADERHGALFVLDTRLQGRIRLLHRTVAYAGILDWRVPDSSGLRNK